MLIDEFNKLNLDTSSIGFMSGDKESGYFCAPEEAEVFGWAGVDGIHYCFVDGFGDMVFAVCPMNTPGEYVHPLARSFAEFLRLLLTCGNTAALDQAYAWNQEQFDAFLRDNPLSTESTSVLKEISKNLMSTPIEDPFSYIKELQAEFDYSTLKFSDEYYDIVPVEPAKPLEPLEWKVYFNGNFWGHHGREKAGREITLDKHFVWGKRNWFVPAVYSCAKGLVFDLCVQIEPQHIIDFMEKWNITADRDGTGFTPEQQMEIVAENPLNLSINAEAVVNGKILRTSQSSGITWIPNSHENDSESRHVLSHYGLDPAYGWVIQRIAFPWPTKRRMEIKSLSVKLSQEPVKVGGPHFHVSSVADKVTFTHPVTVTQHTLVVQEYEPQELPSEHSCDDGYEFPTHFVAMIYTLSPDLPDEELSIFDCMESDIPRKINTDQKTYPFEPEAVNSIGIIGFVDGPTAILWGNGGESKLHCACSALHFKPVDNIEWRMVFRNKTLEDITVELI